MRYIYAAIVAITVIIGTLPTVATARDNGVSHMRPQPQACFPWSGCRK